MSKLLKEYEAKFCQKKYNRENKCAGPGWLSNVELGAARNSRPVPGCQIEFTSKLDSDQLLPTQPYSQQPDTQRREMAEQL